MLLVSQPPPNGALKHSDAMLEEFFLATNALEAKH